MTNIHLDNERGRFEPRRRLRVTVVYPRPWWRRLLGLPAKRVVRGPLDVHPWPAEQP